MRFIPRSRARSKMASTSLWPNSLPHSPPNCQVPMPMTETRRPVLPSLRYFMRGEDTRKTQLKGRVDSRGLVLPLLPRGGRVALGDLVDGRPERAHDARLDLGLLDGAADIDLEQLGSGALEQVVEERDLQATRVVGDECQAHLLGVE